MRIEIIRVGNAHGGKYPNLLYPCVEWLPGISPTIASGAEKIPSKNPYGRRIFFLKNPFESYERNTESVFLNTLILIH